jgi:hypothetical protein
MSIKRRVGGESPRDADSLGVRRPKVATRIGRGSGWRQADKVEQFIGARCNLRARPTQQPRHGRHVLADGEVGQQADLLDDVANPPAKLGWVIGHDVVAVDEDLAGRRLDQPVDHLESGRFAGTRRPNEDADLAAGTSKERSSTAVVAVAPVP